MSVSTTSLSFTEEKIELVLRLYTAGHSPNSERARLHLQHICDTYLDEEFQIEYVDVWENPEIALADRVFATPALKKLTPDPVALILGDLSQVEQVLLALGIGANAA
jgi:circadian clock protein KaiB